MTSIFFFGSMVAGPAFLVLSVVFGRVAWRERRLSALWPAAVALVALVAMELLGLVDLQLRAGSID